MRLFISILAVTGSLPYIKTLTEQLREWMAASPMRQAIIDEFAFVMPCADGTFKALDYFSEQQIGGIRNFTGHQENEKTLSKFQRVSTLLPLFIEGRHHGTRRQVGRDKGHADMSDAPPPPKHAVVTKISQIVIDQYSKMQLFKFGAPLLFAKQASRSAALTQFDYRGFATPSTGNPLISAVAFQAMELADNRLLAFYRANTYKSTLDDSVIGIDGQVGRGHFSMISTLERDEVERIAFRNRAVTETDVRALELDKFGIEKLVTVKQAQLEIQHFLTSAEHKESLDGIHPPAQNANKQELVRCLSKIRTALGADELLRVAREMGWAPIKPVDRAEHNSPLHRFLHLGVDTSVIPERSVALTSMKRSAEEDLPRTRVPQRPELDRQTSCTSSIQSEDVITLSQET